MVAEHGGQIAAVHGRRPLLDQVSDLVLVIGHTVYDPPRTPN